MYVQVRTYMDSSSSSSITSYVNQVFIIYSYDHTITFTSSIIIYDKFVYRYIYNK